MRNLKKVAAILTAATLCLGASMTAFAAEVPSETPNEVQEPNLVQDPATVSSLHWGNTKVLDADGNTVPVAVYSDPELAEKLCTEGVVEDILKDNGLVLGEGQEVKVIAAGEIEVWDDTYESTGEYNLIFTIAKEDDKELSAGDVVYVLHETAPGEWEVYGPIEVTGTKGNLSVSVTTKSLSPFAIIKVMSDGKTVVLDEAGKEPTSVKADAPDAKKGTRTLSPKTGI